MNRPPVWFTAVVAVALAWNIIGLLAVVSDLLAFRSMSRHSRRSA
jgi:hypothetical protein